MSQPSFVTGFQYSQKQQQNSQDSRHIRAQSLHLQTNKNQPKYLNAPKMFMKKAVNLSEFNSDANGEMLKNILVEEFSTIQKDFDTQARITKNVAKSDAEYFERVRKMDMKTQQQLQKIEQNKQATQEKQIKIKKKKNALKARDFQERKKEIQTKERQAYLKKMENYKKKMDEFFKQKEHKEYIRSQFKYDQSIYENMMRRKQEKQKYEYEESDKMLRNFMEKQNRASSAHERIINQKKEKLLNDQLNRKDLLTKQKQQEEELNQTVVQNIGEKMKKVEDTQEQKLKQLDLERRKQKRKLKMREEQRVYNIQEMKNQQEKLKKAQTERYEKVHKALVESMEPIETMYDLTMKKKQLNEYRTAQTRYNQQMLEQQKGFKNDNVIDKHLLHSQQIHTTKEVRQRIKDYRLNVRFRQNEEIRRDKMNQSFT